MRVYLDSCIIIYLVEVNSSLSQKIEPLLDDPLLLACASGVVRMECLVGPLKQNNEGLAETYRTFLDTLEMLPITDAVCERAASLRAKHNLLLPDALHLAIAEVNACDEFWTADTHFERMIGQVKPRIHLIA